MYARHGDADRAVREAWFACRYPALVFGAWTYTEDYCGEYILKQSVWVRGCGRRAGHHAWPFREMRCARCAKAVRKQLECPTWVQITGGAV